MKVCTDACIFGAWVANKMDRGETVPRHILDIGSGTGLLSLMLAQKSTAEIDAVEIDADAASQSKENIEGSPWKEKIRVINVSVTEFAKDKKYDLIISNPPFFEDQLASPDVKKNTAMHSTSLTLKELAVTVKELLSPAGKAAILLPYDRKEFFEEILNNLPLYINEIVNLSHSRSHKAFRRFMFISNENKSSPEREMIIKDNTGEYTPEFIFLLKDYYRDL